MGYKLPVYAETSVNIMNNSDYAAATERQTGFMPQTAANSAMMNSILRALSNAMNGVLAYASYQWNYTGGPNNTEQTFGPESAFDDTAGFRLITYRGHIGASYSEVTQGTKYVHFKVKPFHYYKITFYAYADVRQYSSGTVQPSYTQTISLNGTQLYSKTLYAATVGAGAFDEIFSLETLTAGNGNQGSIPYVAAFDMRSNDHEYGGSGTTLVSTKIGLNQSSTGSDNYIHMSFTGYNYVGSGSTPSVYFYCSIISSDPEVKLKATNSSSNPF